MSRAEVIEAQRFGPGGRRQRQGPRFRHQPGLDGLRAVAVFAVLIFHGGGTTWLPGGFLGVDLFFVISGYLITSLLLVEWDRDHTIALGHFWARRARRLLPALLLLLVAVSAYAHFIADPVSRTTIRWDSLASLFYVANWRFIFGHVGYFAANAAPSPVRHLWSLAVEEQWYLFFPPLLLLTLRKWGKRAVLPLLFAAAGLSFAWMAVLSFRGADVTRTYEALDTRAGVILVGAILAVLVHGRAGERDPRAPIHLVAPLILIAIGAFFVVAHGDDTWMYRGGFLVFAILGALIVLEASDAEDGLLGWLLLPRPVRYLGRISYGIYLWHWPVDLVLTPARLGIGGVALFGLRTVTAVAIAAISYELLEEPIRSRRLKVPHPKVLVPAALVVVASLLVVGTTGAEDGFVSAFSGDRATLEIGPGYTPTGLSAGELPVGAKSPPAAPRAGTLKVSIVGDSVAFTLDYYRPKTPGMVVTSGAMIGCGIMGDAPHEQGGSPLPDCPKWQQKWRNGLTPDANVVLIVLGVWELDDYYVDGQKISPNTRAGTAYLEGQFEKAIAAAKQEGNPRIAFLQLPCGAVPDQGLGEDDTKVRTMDPKKVSWFNDALKQVVARHPGEATIISISDHLCPGGKPVYRLDGTLLRKDGTHWNEQSAPIAWGWLAPQLAEVARAPHLSPVTTSG